MASVLYVTEYSGLAMVQVAGQVAPIVQLPALAEQAIVITGTSGQTAAFNDKTTIIRIHNDAGAPAAFSAGTNPTATVAGTGTGSARLAAGQTEYFGVPKGQAFKVAGIVTT